MPLDDHGSLGRTRRPACPSAPWRPGGGAVPRPGRDRGQPRGGASGDGPPGGVRRAVARRLRCDPRDDARGLPADRAGRCDCSRAGRSARRFRAAVPARLRHSDVACSAGPARAPGSTGRPVMATSRRTDAGSAVAVLSEPAGARGRVAQPAGGAQRLTDALVGYLRELGGELRPARRSRRSSRCTAGSPASARGGERCPPTWCSPTVMPHALLAIAGDALWPGRYRALLAATATGRRPSRSTGRSTGRSPGRPGAARAGTVHVGGGEQELVQTIAEQPATGCPTARSCCSGNSARRSITRAGGQAHRLGLHARPAIGSDWSAQLERSRRADRGAGRALRTRVPRSDPRPPRAGSGRARAARPEPGRRRCRRRQLPAASGRVPAGPRPVALPDAARGACSSAAPRRSPAAPCTGSPATPPRRPRSPTCRSKRRLASWSGSRPPRARRACRLAAATAVLTVTVCMAWRHPPPAPSRDRTECPLPAFPIDSSVGSRSIGGPSLLQPAAGHPRVQLLERPRRGGAFPRRPISRILSRTAIHLRGLPGPWRATCERSCLA